MRTLALLLVSLAVSLALLEAALRLSGRVPVQSLHSVSAEDYERLPGMWEPHQDFVSRQNPALPFRVRTNALGLRGPETTRRPTRPRVLCLGDSFTFGDFVDDEETLPAQLATHLGDVVEVLNGGVGGTTIVDQRVFLERLLALEPDVVVLVFFENDLRDLLLEVPLHEQFARNRRWKSGIGGSLYAAVRDTATFNAVLRLRTAWRMRRLPRAAGDGTTPAFPLARTVARYTAAVAEMRGFLEARGVDLVVATYPSAERMDGRAETDVIGAVGRALRARGIDPVDLTVPLRASRLSARELYLLPEDGHPRGRAHTIAAAALAPAVRAALVRRGDPPAGRARAAAHGG